MQTILLQNVSTTEVKAVSKAIALSDKEEYSVIRIDISELKQYSKELSFGAVPIGSVEFCREAMKCFGMKEPSVNPYPNISWDPYYRVVTKLPVGFALASGTKMFIKPVKVKQFNGFVYNNQIPVMSLDDHDKEQVKALMKLPDNEQVFISDVVEFLSEFRYYIDNNEIVGYARYDSSDEEGEQIIPDISIVEKFASKLNKQHPYCLDFGVLKTGETAIVEYNSFWAIGFYPGAISEKKYLDMLIKCWSRMRS